jgi:hypothetical protein
MSSLTDTTIIRNRINEIRSALFFNEGGYPGVYSAGIISALDVNDEGQILFFINKPEFMLTEDRRFPARLEFYRKGKPFFIKVYGVAEIVTEGDQLRKYIRVYDFQQGIAEKKLALVKVSVQQAECNAGEDAFDTAALKKVFQQFFAWFSLPRPFNFSNG